MFPRLTIACLLASIGVLACTAAPTGPGSPAVPVPEETQPADTAAGAVSVQASRAQVLTAANASFNQGDLTSADQLYQRVLNSPPSTGEATGASASIEGLARFRQILIAAIEKSDAQVQTRLTDAQQTDPSDPFTRLAAQFVDQYSMTANPTAACAQLGPYVGSQAGDALAVLDASGVSIDALAVCHVPPPPAP